MTGLGTRLESPTTARYHREAVEEITQCIEERVFCALLGPHLCGKTELLRYVDHNLSGLLGWITVFIDLQSIEATTQGAFFTGLIEIIAGQIEAAVGVKLDPPLSTPASSADFRSFLLESMTQIKRDIVLLIDPLEALPIDLLQALLTSLRAAYMDQQLMQNQMTVVVSGALSLATLTVGESSPFRGIARRVFVGDLSQAESKALILEFLAQSGVSATVKAIERLLEATRGDIFLINRITQCGIDLAYSRENCRLYSKDVRMLVNRFLRLEVYNYTPLIEAIRMMEGNPELVALVLQLLGNHQLTRKNLSLPLSPDLDPLILTGIVEKNSVGNYRIQNEIYRRFLGQYFTAARVGQLYAAAGRWDEAVSSLESHLIQDDIDTREALLQMAVQAMYTSQDLEHAVQFLRRSLSAAFGINNNRIWFRPPQGKSLIPLRQPHEKAETGPEPIGLRDDRLEARAFRNQIPLRGTEGEGKVVKAIPLVIPGHQPVGVVTILDDLTRQTLSGIRERDTELHAFLNQAARALHTASLRRHELALAGRVQANLLPKRYPVLQGWDLAATWRPARETSGDFYDFIPLSDGKLGIVIADVVDKGMGAALYMALTRTLVRSYIQAHSQQPGGLLQAVHERIHSDLSSGMFVTLFVGILDPSTGRLIYSNAGHPSPIISDQGSETLELLSVNGPPLGMASNPNWDCSETMIPPGSGIYLFTDGIQDIQGGEGEFFGDRALYQAVLSQGGKPAQEAVEALYTAVIQFDQAETQTDDITLAVLVRSP